MPQALTARQAAVLSLVGRGSTNREIAEALGISENGAKGHVARLLAKFGVPSRAALVRADGMDGSLLPPGNETLRLLQDSLGEVVGTTAAATLVKRACKRAGIEDWQHATTASNDSTHTTTLVVKELWPLLIEMTGAVLVKRLQARGFDTDGRVDAEELAQWLK